MYLSTVWKMKSVHPRCQTAGQTGPFQSPPSQRDPRPQSRKLTSWNPNWSQCTPNRTRAKDDQAWQIPFIILKKCSIFISSSLSTLFNRCLLNVHAIESGFWYHEPILKNPYRRETSPTQTNSPKSSSPIKVITVFSARRVEYFPK